ncbi:MAG: hypothetical protein ACLFRI_05330 [Candidatus Izemoplasmataceae bacterium]
MKRLLGLIGAMLFLISIVSPITINADIAEVVYIDQDGCLDCQAVKDSGVLEDLEDDGITVTIYDIYEDPLIADAYAWAYEIEGGKAAPVIFSGDVYFKGSEAIIEAYQDGLIQSNSVDPLRSIEGYESRDYGFFTGLGLIIIAGLLDGVNPCAIAMLLMFISMVGFTKDRKILTTISISYIGAIFVTYFLIGLGFLRLLGLSRNTFVNFSYFLYGGFAILCLFLFIITFYDFYVTRNDEFGKVKNQLPKVIQKLNKKIMARFTKVIHDEEGGFKQALLIVFVPMILGVVVGITEAACTGQIYVAVLASIQSSNVGGALSPTEMLYILVFNLMFVVPLILIALTAVKAKSVMGVSNFIRERMPLIKLVTSIFFMLMAIYFSLQVFDIQVLTFDFNF